MYVINAHCHGNATTSLLDMVRFGPRTAVGRSAMVMSAKGLSYEAYFVHGSVPRTLARDCRYTMYMCHNQTVITCMQVILP